MVVYRPEVDNIDFISQFCCP
jgi:hypothetical protein